MADPMTTRDGTYRTRNVPFRVFVAGDACDITVHTLRGGGAVATGEYFGQSLEAKGDSALGAAEAWEKAAEQLARRRR
jgi:hypothetical protein